MNNYKNSIVQHMVEAGYSEKEAEKNWKVVQDAIKESILKGNPVVIWGFGKLHATTHPAEKKELFGEVVQTYERIKVKFTQSKYLSEVFREKYSETSKKRSKILGALKNLK